MDAPKLVRDDVFDPEFVAAQMPHGIEQITRIGASTGLRPHESAALMNAIQHVAVARTRLGIPIFVHEESVGGFCHRDATVFPQGIGLAATWNPALVEEVAGVIRAQMLAVGARLALLLHLEITYADGATERMIMDQNWRAATGTMGSFMIGLLDTLCCVPSD